MNTEPGNSRRRFLLHSAALSATSILTPSILSGCAAFPENITAKDNTPSWKLGWKSVESDALSPRKMSVRGKIPSALHGAFYRNGPAKYERAGEHYQHWFDGDGMVQKYQITDKGIEHSGKFIHTEKYLAEEQALQFLHSGAGTVLADKSASKANAGWLLQTALNYQKARTEVYVFDALSISSGSIAMATMDRATPLGFHGTFVDA